MFSVCCLCISILCLLVGVGILFASVRSEKDIVQASSMVLETTEPSSQEVTSEIQAEPASEIAIDIGGAVKNPGLYLLDEDARVAEAINISGGFAPKADQVYISRNLNLAKKVADEEKIYVPYKGEQLSGSTQEPVRVKSSEMKKISINTASATELESLEGIGSVRAQKIIELRPYETLESLLEKGAVGESTFLKMQQSITL